MPIPARHPGFQSGLRLWLLRHAEVDEAWQGRAYGDLDVPLSEEGAATTIRVAGEFAGLEVAQVFTSPLSRASELGRRVAEAAGAPLRVDDGLRELSRGSWQGERSDALAEQDPEGVRSYYADPWSYTAHGGECDEQLLTRAWPTVEGATREHAAATVVLTSHYNVIRVLAARLLGIDAPRSFAFRVDPGRCTLFVDEPEGWVLHASNTTGPQA